MQAHSWQGPLPQPSDLAQFDAIVPGLANRIVTAWEEESEHRRAIERQEQRSYYRDALISKIFAFVFVIAALALSGFSVWMGAAWIGAILGAGTIGAVVGAFLHRSKPRNGN